MPLPPLTHVNFTMTLSKNSANANVASERKIPPSRSAGSATSAPTAAAMQPASSMPTSTDIPSSCAS